MASAYRAGTTYPALGYGRRLFFSSPSRFAFLLVLAHSHGLYEFSISLPTSPLLHIIRVAYAHHHTDHCRNHIVALSATFVCGVNGKILNYTFFSKTKNFFKGNTQQSPLARFRMFEQLARSIISLLVRFRNNESDRENR